MINEFSYPAGTISNMTTFPYNKCLLWSVILLALSWYFSWMANAFQHSCNKLVAEYKWEIYYCNVHSYVLGMSWDIMNYAFATWSRDWGRQQWRGHWGKSSLNDLEPQVWKSQVLNEADGWELRKKKPVHHPDFPVCVCFSVCFDFEEWGRLSVTHALALVSAVFMLPSMVKGNGARREARCTYVFLV